MKNFTLGLLAFFGSLQGLITITGNFLRLIWVTTLRAGFLFIALLFIATSLKYSPNLGGIIDMLKALFSVAG